MDEELQRDKQVPAKITTIKVSEATKKRIEHLKRYPRETYEEILVRILETLNLARQNPEQARFQLFKLDKERRRNLKLPLLKTAVKQKVQ